MVARSRSGKSRSRRRTSSKEEKEGRRDMAGTRSTSRGKNVTDKKRSLSGRRSMKRSHSPPKRRNRSRSDRDHVDEKRTGTEGVGQYKGKERSRSPPNAVRNKSFSPPRRSSMKNRSTSRAKDRSEGRGRNEEYGRKDEKDDVVGGKNEKKRGTALLSPSRSRSRSPKNEKQKSRNGSKSLSRGRTGNRNRSKSDPRSKSRNRSKGSRSPPKREKATVEMWRSDKGFGFIRPHCGGEDIFVHASSLADGNMLRDGDEVTYEPGYDRDKGKPRADKVLGAREESADDRSRLPELCWHYTKRGRCEYGNRCQFRHKSPSRRRGRRSRRRSRSRSYRRRRRTPSRRRSRSGGRRGRSTSWSRGRG